MQLYHRVVRHSGTAEGDVPTEVVRKGAIKSIHVSAEDRHAGRKCVASETHSPDDPHSLTFLSLFFGE